MLVDDSRISVTVATIEFHGSNSATQLVLTEQGVFLDGHETVAQSSPSQLTPVGGRSPVRCLP